MDETEKEHPNIPPTRTVKPFGSRHIQTLMTFFSIVNAYAMRVNLSVGIVAMTDKNTNPDFPVVDWDYKTKGIILSSFFYGYLLFQIPAGQLAGRYGPKYILGGAVLYCGLLTLFTPIASLHGGWAPVFVLRVLQGIGQGCIFPCVNTHLSKWAPPLERSRLFSFVFSGTTMGTVLALYVSGQLAAGPGGWPSIFYVTGLSAVIWSILWFYIGSDSPADHKTIREEERHYIQTSLIHSSPNSKTMTVPWKAIVTSVPMWALLIAHLSQNWGYWTLLTLMPSYMNAVLGFNIKSNGTLSAMPYLINFFLTLTFSFIADLINEKQIVSLNFARKMWNSIGLWGGAMSLVLLGSLMKSVTSSVILLTIAVALNSSTAMGFLTNHLDLAPNFAGVLMGITNGLANITSILGPTLAGFIVTDEKDETKWKLVFFISAGVFFVGNTIFILFGSTDVQKWNEPPQRPNSPTESAQLDSKEGSTYGSTHYASLPSLTYAS